MNSKEYISNKKAQMQEMRIRVYADNFMRKNGYIMIEPEFIQGVIRTIISKISLEELETGWFDHILVEAYENEYLKREREQREAKSLKR